MFRFFIVALASLSLVACQTTSPQIDHHGPSYTTHASWYGGGEALSKHTATGERFNPMGLTAAHRTLPFGTRLHLRNPKTGQSVTVRINDRGPASWTGRSLDVSKGAAIALGFHRNGTANLQVSR